MLRLMFVLWVTCLAAFCQEICKVQETQRLDTVTGRFSLGLSSVTLTLPHELYRSDPSVVYMQVAGAGLSEEYLLASGREKVSIRDGGALHLFPQRNKRLTFSVIERDGHHLCDWVANVGTYKNGPAQIGEGFGSSVPPEARGFKFHLFRNAGNPILLRVGGRLASESASFSIDGLPMTVLARNASQVVLQDPHPVAGLRSIESRGYSIVLPFLVVRLDLAGPTSSGRNTLEIKVLGRDGIDWPTLPHRILKLINFDPGRLELSCGKPTGYGERDISLSGKSADVALSCKVQLLKPGPLDLDAVVMEYGFGKRTLRDQMPRWPSPPWPRIPITEFVRPNWTRSVIETPAQSETSGLEGSDSAKF